MPEAVVLLFLECVKLSLELTLEIVRGQPIESREKFWARHDRDVERWRKMLKLDD